MDMDAMKKALKENPEIVYDFIDALFGEGARYLPKDVIDKKLGQVIAVLVRERCGEITPAERVKMLQELKVI